MTRKKKIIVGFSLFAVLLLFSGGLYFVKQNFSADSGTPAPIVRWTGVGTDGTCGGQADSGKWWSCALNWSAGAPPTAADHVVFDATSVKDSIIDSAFIGTVDSITINHSYSGIITQQRGLSVTHDFAQNGATFNSNPSYPFSVGGSFFIADNQINNGEVKAIKRDSVGNIYVGGSFQNVNNLPIRYLAKFDGDKWAAVGDAFDQPVEAITIDSTNNVYAGGTFTKVGSLTVNGIAKWDGNSWSSIGGVFEGYGLAKIPGEVKVLAVDSANRIYVGGTFEQAGSLQYANHLARWNGTTWERFGYGVGDAATTSELPGYINNIIVKDNPTPGAADKDIYLGGNFAFLCGNDLCTSGNTTVDNLVKYDGSTQAMAQYAGGTAKLVQAMTFDSGGAFYVAGDSGIKVSQSVAKWDGAVWAGMGSFNGTVTAIVANGTDIYIGGSSLLYNNLLQWDALGSTPSFIKFAGQVGDSVGRGVDGDVNVIENIGGKLYIGGAFSTICYNAVTCNRDITTASASTLALYDTVEKTTTRFLAPANFSRFIGGDGQSSGTPYLIPDIYSLQAVVGMNSLEPFVAPSTLSKSKHFALNNDIDASVTANWNSTSNFLPLSSEKKSFWGEFDGKGHAISNLHIGSFANNAGLFGVLASGSNVHDLVIASSTLTSTTFEENAGLLAGKNFGTVKNITVSGNINVSSSSTSPGHNLGGVIGYNGNADYGSSYHYTGPFSSTAQHYVSGDMVSSGSALYTCIRYYVAPETHPLSDTTYWQRYSGPYNFRGQYDQSVTYATNDLVLFGTFFVAIAPSTGKTLYAREYWKGTGDLAVNSISDSTANVTINSSYVSEVGGFLGTTERTQVKLRYDAYGYKYSVKSEIDIALSNLSSSGSLVAMNTRGNIGGLIGKQDYENAIISNSASSVSISVNIDSALGLDGEGTENIGGLTGYSFGSIIDSHASGTVSVVASVNNVDLSAIGGLSGKIDSQNLADPIFSGSYATGAVNVNQGNGSVGNVGGLAGESNTGWIGLSYSNGRVTVGSTGEIKSIGGLIGFANQSGVTSSYSTGGMAVDNHSATNQLASGSFGGLIGFANHLTVDSSHSAGDISVSSDSSCQSAGGVGGLVGIFSGNSTNKITQSYTDSRITFGGCKKIGVLFGWSTTHKPADINNDNVINSIDFTLLSFNWGNSPVNQNADLNGDGKIDGIDFTLLFYWWGK